jgi:hypothetical protein
VLMLDLLDLFYHMLWIQLHRWCAKCFSSSDSALNPSA